MTFNPFAPIGAKIFAGTSAVLLFASAGLYIWGDSWRDDAGDLQTKIDKLETATRGIVLAIRMAAGNSDVTLETAAGQVVALGESNKNLKFELGRQNDAIDEMARQAVQAGREREELARLLAKAKAQREGALRRLSDLSITPGTRSDCLLLLEEANQATVILRDAAKETGI